MTPLRKKLLEETIYAALVFFLGASFALEYWGWVAGLGFIWAMVFAAKLTGKW